MNSRYTKSFPIILTFALSTMLLGCMEGFVNPLAKCTDKQVLTKLTHLIEADSISGSKAQLNEDSIMLIGINEKTKMKTCKIKVDYMLENETNNSVLSIMNEMPFVSKLSKNIDLTYTITPTKDQKDFILKIID